ncbi:MAG: type II toxin-antitoxin system RelE/ParE family toxin [Bacteroidales bacterium]
MVYDIRIKKSALKELEKFPRQAIVAIDNKILGLEIDPRSSGFKKLTAIPDMFRIRCGDYRIIYTINDNENIVEILKIKHRKEAYK